MPDDPVTILRRSRAAENQTRNLYRGRGDLGPLVEYLERERDAYLTTAVAYTESRDRSGYGTVAKVLENIATVLTNAIDELDVILAHAGNIAWE